MPDEAESVQERESEFKFAIASAPKLPIIKRNENTE